ncbi:uncharacterized protein LOC131976895 [Centropristis striata]|uniref:uncharacterized protein LOC131976895 n=1 Tax=Centropristis striata TaxID=184440 RepID=UPI0027E016F7|nr:uncharacterized protein LOC131976895 [Centropristis striata]
MAALKVFLTLSVCLLLAHQTSARSDAPCQRSTYYKGYKNFIERHVRAGIPNSLNQNEWEKYIRNHGGCSRPTQSFLPESDLDRVNAVCSTKGGVVYKDNLCISRDSFKFVTVRSEPGTCGIRSVTQETKHLILACEELNNQCLPVHFEGNPTNAKPNNNARGCQEQPRPGGDAPSSFKMSWLWLLAALLVIIYGYQH